MNRSVFLAVTLAAGCTTDPDDHAEHHDQAPGGSDQLIVRTEPAVARPGEPVTLHLMIHTADGGMVRDFSAVHDQRVHLVVVRDGLDEFAHLHPDVDGRGNLTVTYTFPRPGTYRLFADYQPVGQDHAVAAAEVRVEGRSVPAAPLVPDAPGRVAGDGLTADVVVGRRGHDTEFRFTVADGGRVVSDLQTHMGGLGHLILVGADGTEYVHVHPVDGALAFRAHPTAGLYKGWLQVRRHGRTHTIPFVVRIP